MTEIEWDISACGVFFCHCICDRHKYHNDNNVEAPLDARKEVGPDVNTEKAENWFISAEHSTKF